MARIVGCGEGMLELSRAGDTWRMGYGGDTLNTSIHLARAGHEVAYLTALGTDPFSELLKHSWREEGVDDSLVLAHPTRRPGLYAIVTDEAGERSFVYWRESSAAREMLDLASSAEALERATEANLFFYSLITLAILPPDARERLFALCRSVRERGGLVAFDGNYRPRLWQSAESARQARDLAIACADIGLPTLEDEAMLSDDASADGIAARWTSLGCAETIVKLGPQGCRTPDGRVVPPPQVLAPVDTSGAGDAFNGGYLAARMRGESIEHAALAGHRLAGLVVMQPGAIPPREAPSA